MTLKEAVEKFESTYIKEIISQSVTLNEAAEKLGISRTVLFNKRRKYKLLDVTPGSSELLPVTTEWLFDLGGKKSGVGLKYTITFPEKGLVFRYVGPHWTLRSIKDQEQWVCHLRTRAQALEKLNSGT